MKLFNKANADEHKDSGLPEEKENEDNVIKVQNADLLQKNHEILQQLEVISKKIDVIDKNNKKFLMTASMNKSDELEKRIASMKQGAISLLDQMDILIAATFENADEKTKEGILMSMNGISTTLPVFGIEEILTDVGDSFNPDIHKCVETACDTEQGDDVILALVKRGYKDSENGLIIRPVEVIVNKI